VAWGRGDERHPLEKVLAEFKRVFGDVWIDLARVEKAEDRDFVDALLETEPNRLGEEFRAALTLQTGGNPLFAVELLQAMQERGDLIRDDGHWVEGPALDWGMLPARVEATIAERIGRLEKVHREILSIASVEGEIFTAQVVAQVQGVGERKLLQGLSGELEQRHHLVRELGEIEAGSRRLSQYRFSHDLFQQYLYESLSLGERRLLHGEVAAALEALYEGAAEGVAVQLARHYSQAGENQSALKYLEMAGRAAIAAYAYQEAENHFRHALALNPTHLQRANLLSQLGTSLNGQRRLQESIQTWDDAIKLYRTLGPEGLDGMALLYSATALTASGESPPEALKVCQTGLRAVAGAPDGSGLGSLLLQTARAYHVSGLPEEAWDFCHQAMAMARRLGDIHLEAEVLTLQGLLPRQPAQESIKALTKAIELAESVGENVTALRALGNLSNRVPDLGARRENLLRAAALARQYGRSEVYYLGALSLHAFRKLGALDEAEATLNTMHHQLADLAEESWTSIMITRLAEAALQICRGEWAQVIEPLRECQADARQRGDRQYLMYTDADLAFALMESGILGDGSTAGGWEEAEMALTEAVELAAHLHTTTENPTLWRCYLIRLKAIQGHFREAHTLLAEALEARDAAGLQINLITEAYLLSAEADLAAAEGYYAEAIRTFAEAVETFDQLGMRWDHARNLIDWANAHRGRNQSGDLEHARERLQESLKMFEEMGAPGYVAVVEEKLGRLAK
jgi:tetratricopeptide (TPR) repeat protein